MLKREIEMLVTDPSVFSTDSMSVLRYVKNENRRFQTFDANRIAVIRDGSNPDQWYHAEGKQYLKMSNKKPSQRSSMSSVN